MVDHLCDDGQTGSSMETAMPSNPKKPIHEVRISVFKAKYVSLLEHVRKTGTLIRITRRGKAIADVIPVSSGIEERSWIGSMMDSISLPVSARAACYAPPCMSSRPYDAEWSWRIHAKTRKGQGARLPYPTQHAGPSAGSPRHRLLFSTRGKRPWRGESFRQARRMHDGCHE
jgi:antitoxin (DNA-binding transcriptional repressor) of toxin-antitoxin stability system